MNETSDIRTVVREKYGAIAAGKSGAVDCCGGGAAGGGCGCEGDVLTEIGYSKDQAAAIPEGANLGLGCGNPIALAQLRAGETVLDLGSGAGIDCFLAAREVGETGHVIGVDMTPAMLERARANAAKGSYPQVEFRLGEIEHLPVADATVDAIVSNCVINLSPDKPQVFREAYRALKRGGRMLVSDLVLVKPLSAEVLNSVECYVGCVAGASLKADYLAMMRAAGFADVEVVQENAYTVGSDDLTPGSLASEAYGSVTSVKVRAVKR